MMKSTLPLCPGYLYNFCSHSCASMAGTQHIDYILAFLQAPVQKTLFIEIPKQFKMEGKLDANN